MSADADNYFTLVFKGDIRLFKGNPLKTETPFGVPVAAGIGDAMGRVDELEDQIELFESSRESVRAQRELGRRQQ